MKRTCLIFLILFSCVGCDQGTKSLARHNLSGTAPLSFLNDTIRLQYVENAGAFLGLGANSPDNVRFWIFTFSVGVILVGVLYFLLKARNLPTHFTAALALVLAGGVGNLIDRVFNEGRVVDFLFLGIGPIRTGVFNVADIAITLGAAFLALFAMRGKAF